MRQVDINAFVSTKHNESEAEVGRNCFLSST